MWVQVLYIEYGKDIILEKIVSDYEYREMYINKYITILSANIVKVKERE